MLYLYIKFIWNHCFFRYMYAVKKCIYKTLSRAVNRQLCYALLNGTYISGETHTVCIIIIWPCICVTTLERDHLWHVYTIFLNKLCARACVCVGLDRCYSELCPHHGYLEPCLWMRSYIKSDSHMARQCAAALPLCVRNAIMDWCYTSCALCKKNKKTHTLSAFCFLLVSRLLVLLFLVGDSWLQ